MDHLHLHCFVLPIENIDYEIEIYGRLLIPTPIIISKVKEKYLSKATEEGEFFQENTLNPLQRELLEKLGSRPLTRKSGGY